MSFKFNPAWWHFWRVSLFDQGIVLVNKYWDGKKDVKLTLLFPNERLGFWEPHFLFQNLGEMQKVKRAFTALEACKQVEDNMVYHENKLKQSDKIDENERKISTGTIDVCTHKTVISSPTKGEQTDVKCTGGDEACCGEHEHYECEMHSHGHTCVDGMYADVAAPCDCCRHGHTLSSLIRPDDCRSCLRQMGGTYISPKFNQIRQKMLKTLNHRKRDNSEDSEFLKHVVLPTQRPRPTPKQRETVTIYGGSATEDVDVLVRMIEGTQISKDPKKLAKKARQKERKMDEERKREDEERRKREEEERLQKEQELREEEERRKADEMKRLARKTKKKNRKKRAAATDIDQQSKLSSDLVTGQISALTADTVLRENVVGGNATVTVAAVDRPQQNPVPDSTDKKSEMVTIRRHPSQPESVVTISLKGKHGGEDLLYYLINGQIYRNDGTNSDVNPVQTQDESSAPKLNKKKKKKGKVASDEASDNQPHSNSSADPLVNEVCDQSSEFVYSDKDDHNNIDLSAPKRKEDSASCVPVDSPAKDLYTTPCTTLQLNESFQSGFDSSSGVIVGDRNYVHQCMLEDDFFGPTENEEFEEVVSSKTRRKRNKAAKTKESDSLEDQESVRSSPCSGVSTTHSSRRVQSSCDTPIENGITKRSAKTSASLKSGKPKSSRKSNGFEKVCPNPPSRRDQSMYHGSMTMGANVMPRIARAHAKNVETSSRAASMGNESHMYQHVTVEPHHSASGFVGSTTTPHERNDNTKYMPQQQNNTEYINYDTCHVKVMTKDLSQSVVDGSPMVTMTQSVNQTSPGLKFWEQGERNQLPLSLGPFQRQSDTKDESWSPWKEYSWTEGSTPENPSPRFGMEFEPVYPKESSSAVSFQERKLCQTGKGPIQRPVPTTVDSLDMNRDTFSPQHSDVFPYTNNFFAPAPSPRRSHTHANDVSFKRIGGDGPVNKENPRPSSMGLFNDAMYNTNTPTSPGLMNHFPPAISPFNPNNGMDSIRDENSMLGCNANSANLFKSRMQDPSYGRHQQHQSPEFSQNPAMQNTRSRSNQQQQWNLSPAPPRDSEYLYNQQQASILNSSHETLRTAWLNEQRRQEEERFNALHSYESQHFNHLDQGSPRGVQLRNSQVSPHSPVLPQMPSSSERLMNWDYSSQYLQDFTSSAHP